MSFVILGNTSINMHSIISNDSAEGVQYRKWKQRRRISCCKGSLLGSNSNNNEKYTWRKYCYYCILFQIEELNRKKTNYAGGQKLKWQWVSQLINTNIMMIGKKESNK
jgi:hypothetical protein